jgi:hypothetical protein
MKAFIVFETLAPIYETLHCHNPEYHKRNFQSIQNQYTTNCSAVVPSNHNDKFQQGISFSSDKAFG